MDFTGKIAIVTGAARGIGLATVQLLLEHGACVALVDFNRENLEAAAQNLKAYEEKIAVYPCDVSDESQVDAVVDAVQKQYGRIDILVNNAGIYREGTGKFVESQSSTWKHKIEVNILGTMYFTRAVLPGMEANRYGHIINIGSVAAEYGIVNMVDYSMTKGAIVSFTRALAKETSEYNVLVNTVSPGNINDDIHRHPDFSFMNRSGTNRECAQLIVYLASDEAGFISGQNYQIDGCRRKM